MLKALPSLDRFVKKLQGVPYLASKNIYRVAMHFLDADEDYVKNFCNVLLEAKKSLSHCSRCFNWTEGDFCSVCIQPNRDQSIVCVVETWHDLFALERAGGYSGLYHVLGGVLCPLEGIGPEDLRIKPLLKRVDEEQLEEIIFATNPTPEGEATASFILSKLKEKHIKVSKLASGVPIGSSLEAMDRVTIYKALLGRRPF
ncbi:recombination protein RecR [Candidatus Babeliales bacterium]|nr:recombination protein RecR [Candidatus Babeliales bacterium]